MMYTVLNYLGIIYTFIDRNGLTFPPSNDMPIKYIHEYINPRVHYSFYNIEIFL